MNHFVRRSFLTKIKRQPFGCLFVFLLALLFSITSQGTAEPLSKHPQWKALLHIYKGHYEIKDPHFFMSGTAVTTPEKEFALILDALKTRDKNKICRFPARALWIQNNLKIEPFDFNACSELIEFKEKAPANKVAFVFASENISQPTSIMGHSFLKIEGTNKKGIHVEHAISFFTEVEDANFFRLVFESLVTGKKGYYTLTPYHNYKVNYIFGEQRSLWEKYLSLTPESQQLLQFHLFELKGIEFEYFFHSFNCSTLDYNILAVLFPEIQTKRGLWVTPKDVYKAIDNRDYIESTVMLPSSKWRLKALEEALKPNAKTEGYLLEGPPASILAQYVEPDQQYLALELASAVNDFRFESGNKKQDAWSYRYDELKAAKNQLKPDGIVDLSNYKNPRKSPQDSYVYFSTTQQTPASDSSQQFLTLGFVPASHPLMGDNSQYLSESELKIGALALDVGKEVRLGSLVVFAASALQPGTALYRPLSGSFRLGYDRQVSKDLEFKKGLMLEGDLGQTFRFHRDVDFYLLAGTGYRETLKSLYLEPQIGILARLVGNLKMSLGVAANYNKTNSPEPQVRYLSRVSWNHQEFALDFSWNRYELKELAAEEASVGIRYHF